MEILLGALAEAIFGVLIADLAQQPRLAALREKLRGDSPEKVALQHALARAYAVFSRLHPGIAASFFDEHFLQKSEVAAELAKILTPHRSPDKSVLERLWQAQFRYKPQIDLLQPLTDFLDALEDEVKAQPHLQPFVDSRAFEQLYLIAERAEDQVSLQTQTRDVLCEIRDLIEQGQRAQIQASQRPVSPKVGEAVRVLPSVDTTHFTGRSQERNTLVSLILQRPQRERAVVGLWGGPGVGKSALARHFAEEQAEHFPDGVIGLDTRNEDARRLALDFAALIGEPVDPESEWEPSVIMQSRFARRRALLIFDNANRTDIRELIPGGHCAVIVTTRDRDLLDYIGLLPPEAQISLRPFKKDESLIFLGRLVGEQAVREEDASAQELARLVGGLPLALRIAGSTLRSQILRSHPFANYVDDLRDEKSRLRLRQLQWRNVDELNVLAVFRLSLPLLSTEEHKTFACLAACVESGFGLAAATATAGLDEDTAAGHLSRLINLALLNFDPESGRFRLHPLLHLFACDEAKGLHLWSEAQERHAVYFTAYVRERQALGRQNLSDLEAEQDAILQTASWKIEQEDLDVPFWHGLRNLLEHRGHWQTGIELMQGYLALAERTGADSTAAHFHLHLGRYALLLGQFNEAIAAFQRSLDIGEELGDRRHIAMVLNSLGGALQDKGQLDEAIAAFQRSLDILEELGDRRGIGMVRRKLRAARSWKASLEKWGTGQENGELTAVDHRRVGKHLMGKGNFEAALHRFVAALELGIETTQMGYLHGQAGEAALRLEDYETAATHFRRAIALGEDTSFTNASLARALHQMQEAPESIQRHFERALMLDDRNAWAHNWFSTFLKEIGNSAEAEVHARRAVELGPQNAVFLNDLALILMEYGDRAHLLEAQAYFQEAVACAPPDFTWPQRYLQVVEQSLSRTETRDAGGIDRT